MPFKYLHKNLPNYIKDAISWLNRQGYTNSQDIPPTVLIQEVNETMKLHNMLPRTLASPFQVGVSLFDGSLKDFYVSGSEDGISYSRNRRAVQVIEKDYVTIRGYYLTAPVTNKSFISDIEINYYPGQMPKVSNVQVPLNERERKILFCFGALKDGHLRKEALYRLDVSKTEIQGLVDKKVLRKLKKSHCLTELGENSRNFSFSNDLNTIDQW